MTKREQIIEILESDYNIDNIENVSDIADAILAIEQKEKDMNERKIIIRKLKSMRYSKEEVQKETSNDAKQFMYGYTDCINDMLVYLTSGIDGRPEYNLTEYKESKSAKEILAKHERIGLDKYLISTNCKQNVIYPAMEEYAAQSQQQRNQRMTLNMK
jgi:hypothetical protein